MILYYYPLLYFSWEVFLLKKARFRAIMIIDTYK